MTLPSQKDQHGLISLDCWLQSEPHRAALLSRSGQQGIPLLKHCLDTDSLAASVQHVLVLQLVSGCRRGLPRL